MCPPACAPLTDEVRDVVLEVLVLGVLVLGVLAGIGAVAVVTLRIGAVSAGRRRR